jgi:energy-coupling factor transport system permease protein
MALAGRRSVRTRYRPDPWALPEWLVALSGIVPAAVLVVVSVTDRAVLVGPVSPPWWPALPLGPLVAILVGVVAGIASPRPPGSVVPTLHHHDRSDDREEVAA